MPVLGIVGWEERMASIGHHTCLMSVDVEDWFNILDTPAAPNVEDWDSLEIRFQKPLGRLLDIFDENDVKATFFWLGWFAERFPEFVLECCSRGHEIASHGYAHLLAYKAGQIRFREDINRGKGILEDILGKPVYGFRSAGFSTTKDTPWFYEELAKAGFRYSSSVFPAQRAHGGMSDAPLNPYSVSTAFGDVLEIPQSVVSLLGKRISLFGGGYLRIAPLWLIKRGIKVLEKENRHLVVYVHPRELDTEQPHLNGLPFIRRFKCYVNLKSTERKIISLTQQCRFERIDSLIGDSGSGIINCE